MKILIIMIIIMTLLFSCNKKNKIDNIKGLYNILQTSDSLYLNFPDSLFPKRIEDIVLTKEYLYILNLNFSTKYPIIKLNRKGDFIKIIGKIGGGPNEIKFLPFKISGNKKILVAGSPTLNTIYIFKEDTLFTKRSFLFDQMKFSDLKILNDDNIVCSNYGDTKYHLLLLDSNLNIKHKYIKMPKQASLITLAGFLNFYAITGDKNSIYSHYSYPPNLNKIEFNINNNKISITENIYKGIDLSKYVKPKYEKILRNFQKGKIRKFDIFKTFSRIHLIYKENNYLLGIYLTSFGENAKKYAFILKNNKLIKEIQIQNDDTKGLFVYDNGLARSIYYEKNGLLKVKIIFLKLNKKYIETL